MTSEVSPLAPSITQAASPVKQLTVFLHNRVGALLALVKLLHDNKVEVLGFSVQDAVEMTLVRLVVTDQHVEGWIDRDVISPFPLEVNNSTHALNPGCARHQSPTGRHTDACGWLRLRARSAQPPAGAYR